MKKSAIVSDVIFTFFFAWLLALCIFRYVQVSLPLALLLSGLCGLLSACALGAFLQSKFQKYFLKRSDAALKDKLSLHLALLSDQAKTDLFCQAFTVRDGENSVKKCSNLRLQTTDCVYFLRLRFSPVTADDVATITRVKTPRKKVLLCLQIDESALALCHSFEIEVQTAEWTFLLLKQTNCLPLNYLGDFPQARKQKRRLHLCFSKKNAKRFLWSAILILLLSFFTPFSYYYLTFGFLLLLAALFIRIFGYV